MTTASVPVRPRLGYAPWGEDLAELTAAGRAAEDAGADTLWASELHRSATVTAAALACATTAPRIGTAVALAFVRSPMICALETIDLDELSAGRTVLGLGTGVRRLNEEWHGAAFGHPVQRLRETVDCVREFIARCADGEPIEAGGSLASLRVRGYRRPPPPRTRVPVHLAAAGPLLTRLAGEIADGWIGHELGSPAHVRDTVLPALRTGLDTAGRERGQLEVVASACVSVHPDPAEALRRASGNVGFYASVRTYAPLFAAHGLAEPQGRVAEWFRAPGTGAGDLAGAVDPAMTRALTLCGTREQVAALLSGYAGIADSLKLTPPVHGLTPREIRESQALALELIRELNG
ncbi:LLM class flavin-dependent oxidoreductase [Streptomyces sp. NPDC090106]|uniref:LLM class flavin-dependent oxidoreductase n=1 Tax=Streptomyces sp. NPDC090106 TaxID=3365946 RepID=UPI0037FA6C5E